ncbi:hypothetical protein JCM9492_12620 [Aquifex pyrophilus]
MFIQRKYRHHTVFYGVNNRKGFTLVEILFVVSIILILLFVGIINGKRYYMKLKFSQYEQSLINLTKLAKLLAREKSHSIAVCVEGRKIKIVDIGTSRNFTCSGEVLSELYIEEREFTVSGEGFSFDPRGLAIKWNHICLSFPSENRYVKVIVGRFGSIRVERGRGPC